MGDDLSSRVDRLERQNRVLKLGLVLGAVGLMTCGGGGITSNFARVNTRTLEIQDANERAQITLQGGVIRFEGEAGPVSLDAATLTKLLAATQ